MPVVHHKDIAVENFSGGSTYQTLVGDAQGSTPVRIGIQTSPPGFRTALHSHPYMEVVTVIEGHGEAWIEGDDAIIALSPGVTLVFPPNTRHWFGAVGDMPMTTYGVHASPERIVNVHGTAGGAAPQDMAVAAGHSSGAFSIGS